MEIKINTKFDIGQEVFVCKRDIQFKDGVFVDNYIAEPVAKKISNILIQYEMKNIDIMYSFFGSTNYISETMVFPTLEKAKKWCQNYE